MTISTWAELEKLAETLEPKLRQAFLRAVATLRQRIAPELVVPLLLSVPSADVVDAVFALAQFGGDLTDVTAITHQAFVRGAVLGAGRISDSLRTPFRFDQTNELAVKAAERNAARLVRQVSTETRNAIRDVIVRAFRQGIAPRDVATLIRPLVGLTRDQAQSVLRRRFELLREGLSEARVLELTERYAAKKLRERATTIARTEILAAANEGQLALWRQARRKGLLPGEPRKRWIVTPDDRLCPRCAPLSGQTRRLQEPFDTSLGPVMRPPLHPRCRCTIGLTFDGGAARSAA